MRYKYLVVMTSQCANPECAIPLRHLKDGRLFQFEIRPNFPQDLGDAESTSGHISRAIKRTISHFWLCGRCSSTFTLVFDVMRGIKVSPR